MNRYLLLVLFILLLPSLLSAQPDPDAGPGNPPPPPNRPGGMAPMGPMINPRSAVVEVTPNGLFLLAEGTLVRYSPDLEQCVTLQLIEPLPPMPMGEDDKERQARQLWIRERMLRSAPAAMLPSGELLYIVFADTLFRVNQNTLKVEKTPLDAPEPGGEEGLIRNLNVPPAPQLKLHGETLYIIRQADLLAVDVKAGTVLKRAALPRELAPAMPLPVPLGPQPNPPFRNEFIRPGGQEEAARAITVVGVLGSRKDGNRAVYTVKDDAGAVYILTGDRLDGLAGTGNVEGRRARVSGTVETRREMPAEVKGILRMETFQLFEE
jgi:hypothetical protein